MPKASAQKLQRHDPLYNSIEEGSGHLRKQSRHKRQQRADPVGEDADQEEYIDPATSRKILELAREQQQEMDDEAHVEDQQLRNTSGYRQPAQLDTDGDESDGAQGDDAWTDDDDEQLEYEELDLDVDPEEDAIFQRYVEEQEGPASGQPMTLADKIMAKVAEMEAKQNGTWKPEPEAGGVMLPPKVIEVYSQVGELLSRFRSGRLPRAFKIVPTLKNWRDVLYVTNPPDWSNQAVYEASKLFVSNLPANQAHRFINEVLLDRFRDQVEEQKNVNYHVYRSLKKALYKPAAFFKGFLFPLLESGTCTLREALIAGSVLARVSVPALHSAAALLHLAESDYSGPTSMFIKVLLDKKYALPYKVVDAMVFHFVRFREHGEKLPVIWHQSFLVFVQRYKNDITEDQRDALLAVCRLQAHPKISPEIRRELLAGTPRITGPEDAKMALS